MGLFRTLGWAIAVTALVGGCARPSVPEWTWVSGYSRLPSGCAELGESVDGAVRGFLGALPGRDRPMHVRTVSERDLWCSLTAENPVPSDRTGPMSRTATVSLTLETTPRMEEAGPTTAVTTSREFTPPASAVGAPESLSGVGDAARIWVVQTADDTVQVEARAVVGNLTIRVITGGHNWNLGYPDGDTASLREDLRAGAESLIAVVARTIPPQLPTAVFDSDSTTTSSSSPISTPNSAAPVWDPCELTRTALAGSELTQTEKSSPDPAHSKSCYWKGSWFNLSVESTEEWFARRFYDRERYVTPTPVEVGGRTGLRLYWVDSEYTCDLVFDVPQGEVEGRQVGVVLLQVNTGVEAGLREEACAKVTSLAEKIVGHLPPGR